MTFTGDGRDVVEENLNIDGAEVDVASKGGETENVMTGKGVEEELGRGKRVIKNRRRSGDDESIGGSDPDQGGDKRRPKSRRGSLDENRGGEDISINPRRRNPQVVQSRQ